MKKAVLSSDFKVMVGIMAVLALPFALTLQTVSLPRTPLVPAQNPTPHGYTWSLSLFFVPVLVLGYWLIGRHEGRMQKWAFWLTTAFVTGGGIFLDVFYGLIFFTFPNKAAVLGINVYGRTTGQGWQKGIPIEEFGFYLFGSLAVLLVYIWGDEFWFGAYNADDSKRRKAGVLDLPSFHPGSAIIGLFVFLAGLFYKKFAPSAIHEGFPEYLLFLVLIALIPSVVFFPVASQFINWRAFSLGILFILLISLFWEATIAVPYGWWDFQDQEMVGLRINGFSRLPIEEPALWLGITWAVVIVYETISTYLYIVWTEPRTRRTPAEMANTTGNSRP